jgi:hypothetical protein
MMDKHSWWVLLASLVVTGGCIYATAAMVQLMVKLTVSYPYQGIVVNTSCAQNTSQFTIESLNHTYYYLGTLDPCNNCCSNWIGREIHWRANAQGSIEKISAHSKWINWPLGYLAILFGLCALLSLLWTTVIVGALIKINCCP